MKQSDAKQAYTQSELKSIGTWMLMPCDPWETGR